MIPFCKYAIVPYCLWYFWIPGTLLLFLRRAPRQEFWRLCMPLFTGMTLALVFCALVPNGLALRPAVVQGGDVFARTVRLLYRSDTSTNVCPSIHVFNSVTVLLAYLRSSLFRAPGRRWVRAAAALLCGSIVLSTMLLKQHSLIDVVFGLLLALTLDALAALNESAPARSRVRSTVESAPPVVLYHPCRAPRQGFFRVRRCRGRLALCCCAAVRDALPRCRAEIPPLALYFCPVVRYDRGNRF